MLKILASYFFDLSIKGLTLKILAMCHGDTFFKDLLRYPLAREGVYAPFGPAFLARALQMVSYIVGLTAIRLAFLWDIDKTKCCNGFYIQFRQTFAKETFSYDEHLKS